MNNKSKLISRGTLFVLFFTAVGLAACTGALTPGAANEAQYLVISKAQITVNNEANSAIVEVQSDNGMGDATVKLVSGEWPESIVMRFHLQGLEGLRFLYGETEVGLSVNTQNMILQGVSVEGSAIEPIDEESDFWMPIKFEDKQGTAVDAPTAGGVIEVETPPDFLNGDYAEFTISWIDFYR